MRYASVCDGIGAVHVAWQGLPLECAWRSEIDRFPEAVVSHRFPNIGANLGDMTKITDEEITRHGPIDLLVGGTPCQSFSVAGLRRGLADPRGNLALAYLALASRSGARWLLWENVPGVLSSNGGRDFGAFLGGLAELGYGFAYRVLDARFFGVPQRRRRVFVVGHLGDWRRAAAVLFERESLRGDLEAGGEAGHPVAGTLGARSGRSVGAQDGLAGHMIPQHARCVTRGEGARGDFETTTMIPVAFSCKDGGADAGSVAPTLRSMGHDGSHANGGGQVAIAFNWQSGGDCRLNPRSDGVDALQRCQTPAVAFTQNQRNEVRVVRNVGALAAEPGMKQQTYLAVDEATSHDTVALGGLTHADAKEARPVEALRALREQVGEEAFSEWCLGVLASFWPTEVLQLDLYGSGVRRQTVPQRGLVNNALSRAADRAPWSVRDVWEAGCSGCPSPGWKPHEQLAAELGAYLSQLPYAPSPGSRFMHDLWQATEGLGLLRQALSAVQDARRSPRGKGEPTHSLAVRRLVVEEAEALQGFPRSYTLVPYRGKPAADGPRYKALGNSMAVPVMRYIGERLVRVDDLAVRP